MEESLRASTEASLEQRDQKIALLRADMEAMGDAFGQTAQSSRLCRLWSIGRNNWGRKDNNGRLPSENASVEEESPKFSKKAKEHVQVEDS